MKKIMVCFLFVFLFFINTKAQVIDQAKIRCLYSYNCIGDLLKPERVIKDEMLLLIGDTYTNFYCISNHISDSLRKVNPAEYSPSVVTIDGRRTVVPARTHLRRNLYASEYYFINRLTQEFQCMDKVGNKFYTYTETLTDPVWETSSDTCTVLKYHCQKATAHYGGRDWTVWFTVDIPTSEGPWKLRGLPGLILKAETADKQFSFEAVGLERLATQQAIRKNEDNDYRKLSKNEFFNLKKNFMEKPFAELGIKVISGDVNVDFNFIEKFLK